MSNLENSIKDCITKELEKGIVEKVISEKLEECVSKALSDMFGYGGEVKKVIEEKVKSVMIPYLENYDYSKYITKLDSVLVDVLKNTSLENKKILENFKDLMATESISEIKMSDIFKAWNEFCESEIDKDNIDYDCGYGFINTSFDIEEVSDDFGHYETYRVFFECEEDDDLKFEFFIHRWRDSRGDKYTSQYRNLGSLRDLRYLDKFEILLMKISQGYENIILDKERDRAEIEIEEEY